MQYTKKKNGYDHKKNVNGEFQLPSTNMDRWRLTTSNIGNSTDTNPDEETDSVIKAESFPFRIHICWTVDQLTTLLDEWVSNKSSWNLAHTVGIHYGKWKTNHYAPRLNDLTSIDLIWHGNIVTTTPLLITGLRPFDWQSSKAIKWLTQQSSLDLRNVMEYVWISYYVNADVCKPHISCRCPKQQELYGLQNSSLEINNCPNVQLCNYQSCWST